MARGEQTVDRRSRPVARPASEREAAAAGASRATPAILVTGAHGAIGSWLLRELIRAGHTVVGLDAAARPVTPFPELHAATVVEGDVRDTARIGALIDAHGVDRIVHLAAIIAGAERDPGLAIEVNALASARLLDVAAERGIRRVVALSTKGVLGELDARHLYPRYEPVPVDLAPSPRTLYEATKHLVEIVVGVNRGRGADAAVVRLGTTWGPGKTGVTHGAFSLHTDVVAAALRGQSSRLAIGPEQGHDLIYYADVAAGLASLVLAEGPLRSPVYHLGSGRITTVGEFAAAVEAAFPGVRVETGAERAAGRSCLMDISLAERDAAYRPGWDVRRALADITDLAAAGIVAP